MFKRIITASIFGVSTLGMMAANATTNGFYVVGQAGYASTHMKNKIAALSPVVPGIKPMPNGGIAGRLGVGYQFNPNLAVELGYLQLPKLKMSIPGTTVDDVLYAPGTLTLKQNAIDLTAKGILPVTDKFNAYAKLGVAYLSSTLTSRSEGVTNNQNENFGIAKHKFAPEVGLGVTYNITNNMFIDTSWTHIQPMGKNKPGNIDFAAVGIGYSFG